jgi:phytoene dehydrogenase-like protein
VRRLGRPYHWTRREWLSATLHGVAASSLATSAGCLADLDPPKIVGEFVESNMSAGHRLRDGLKPTATMSMPWHDVDVAIIGAGVSGLAAARELNKANVRDFVVLELESVAGGTARSGEREGWRFPWGAHYLPLPHPKNQPLVELLEEMKVVSGRDSQGRLIVEEETLCRDPQERLFIDGVWQQEIDPWREADDQELKQAQAWHEAVEHWARWRDDQGRPAFTLPSREGSDAEAVRELDRISMAEWLRRHGWDSPRLRWEIDYACRDDYGLTIDQVSAWAGLFYFCARFDLDSETSQPFLTWPEGNGRIVSHLMQVAGDRLRTGMPVWSIRPLDDEERTKIEVVAGDPEQGTLCGYRARRVICAAPQFVAARLIEGYAAARPALSKSFQYGAWMVANVFLRERMRENGFPLAWDNVNYHGDSLGYVVATHQLGIDHGPTVLTWYHALCDDDPKAARERLLNLTWEEAAAQVLDDLGQVHPEIRRLATRVDIQRWGHAMIRPIPGFRTGDSRTAAMQPFRGVHFAHTDLSGLALFEEAFDHGTRAAREVLQVE